MRGVKRISTRLRERWVLLGLSLALLTAYAPALGAGYIWDDDKHVTESQVLGGLDGLRRMWLEPSSLPQYYPVVHTSFWLEHALWGMAPFGYHLVNVLLHGLAACLFWRLLKGLALPGAGLAALLFAFHPVHVESVAWITERKNVLSLVFALLALLAFLRAEGLGENVGEKGRRRAWFLLYPLFSCALLSKTVTCSLPAVALLLVWWKRGRVTWPSVRNLIPLFLMGLVAAAATVWIEANDLAGTGAGASGPEWEAPLAERLIVAGRVPWFYVAKLLLPMKLIFSYPRWEIDASDIWQYLPLLATLVLVLSLWGWRSRLGRGPLVAVLIFGGVLVPALGLIDVYPMRFSFVADHFQYHASLAMLALLAAGASRFSARRPLLVGAVLVLALFWALTFKQTRHYADAESLWTHTIAQNPGSWMALNNLGRVHFDRGDIEGAARFYRRALALKPDFVDARINVGACLVKVGQPAAALPELRRALRLEPSWEAPRFNLIAALIHLGRRAETVSEYRTHLGYHPDHLRARLDLARTLMALERSEEAHVEYSELLSRHPDSADVHGDLGILLAEDGQWPEALRHFQRAAELAPSSTQHGAALDWALAQQPWSRPSPSGEGLPIRDKPLPHVPALQGPNPREMTP